MGMHNVFRICKDDHATHERNAKARVIPFLVPLVEKLARKNPHWEFHANGHNYSENTQHDVFYYSNLRIMNEGGEDELGWIACEDRNAGMSFTFDGPRLKESRSRGWCQATVNIDKAAKTILGSIYERTLIERMAEAKGAARMAVVNFRNSAVQARDRHHRQLEASFTTYVRKHWDDYAKTAHPTLHAHVEAYPQACQSEHDAELLRAAHNMTVLVDGAEKYHVSRSISDTEPVQTYSTETCPPVIKQGIGMLKLLEVGAVMPSVGVRVKHNLFYVVVPKEESAND